MDVSSLSEGHLLGIGNPLLDISAVVDESLLKKYDLKRDDAIMAEEKHMPLYKELMEKCSSPASIEYKAEFIAGGSVQNSLRAVQWIFKKPSVCTYFGCVGNDDYAKILSQNARAEGLNVLYQVVDDVPTGTCAVLITNTKRSLCANLAAAQKFTADHLAKPESKKYIEAAKAIYTSGFFLVVSVESVMLLINHAVDRDLPFCLNLSAPFVSQFYKERLEKVLPYTDILFGNEAEAEAFAKAFNIEGENLEQIAMKMAALPKKNTKRPRVVVITQGKDPVILIENGTVKLIPVADVAKEKIIDTNGAGDAFAGGFLSQMILGNSFTQCVDCGNYVAGHVIQNSGCTFVGASNFKFTS